MLVIKWVLDVMTGWKVILILNLEVVIVKYLNYNLQMKLVLGTAEV